MVDWLLPLIPILKSVHIAALAIWCGGLIGLPLMLARHKPSVTQQEYVIGRQAAHVTYTICVTPAAVIAVIAGTWLIFAREAFVPWLYLKLVFVAMLVTAHAWIGHNLVLVAESPEDHTPPGPWLPLLTVFVPILGILFLVLGKPALEFPEHPEWLLEPRDNQLLFDVPSR